MKRNILLLLIFYSMSFMSFSQYSWTNGEVILHDGETIVGEIKIPVISKDFVHFNGKSKVKVRNQLTGEKTIFDENQVKLIKFKYPGSKIAFYEYVPVSKNKKEIFCIISTGSVTLYGREVAITSSGHASMSVHGMDEFYVQRSGEHIAKPLKTARPSRSFRKRAIEYFNDCPTVVNTLKSKKIKTADEIIAIVETYNECVEQASNTI